MERGVLHGISDTDVADAPGLAGAWEKLVGWVRRKAPLGALPVILCAHNGFSYDFAVLVQDLGRVGSAIPEDWLLSSLAYEHRVHPDQDDLAGARFLDLDEWHRHAGLADQPPVGLIRTATGHTEGAGGLVRDGADTGGDGIDVWGTHPNLATKAAIQIAEIHADGYNLSLSCLLRVGLFAAFAASFTGFKVRPGDNLVLPGSLPISSLAGFGPKTVAKGQTYPADKGGPITSIGDLRRVYADSYADADPGALTALINAALGKGPVMAASAVAQMVAPEPDNAYAYDPSE